MIVLLVLGFMFLITALYMSTTSATIDSVSNRHSHIAEQMIYYHVAAAQKCGSSCSGAIDPTDALPSFRRNQGMMTANRNFRSVSQNGYVITYYVNEEGGVAAKEAYAGVMAKLIGERAPDTLSFLGQYDQTISGLRLRGDSYWQDPLDGSVRRADAAAVAIGALPAPNGAPVVVNRL